MKRGGAGIVTDGGFRDSPEIAKLAIPAYHHRPAAPTNLTMHQAVDIDARSIRMEVPDDELAQRQAAWTPREVHFERGYGWMFSRHIGQADTGCDFDFLRTDFGAPVREPDIF